MSSTSNPYQSPQGSSIPPASDDRLVQTARMLMKRQGERVGIWMYLQPVFRRHVVFLVIAGLVIWLLLSLGYPWLASLLGVAILTRIGRDLVWYRVLARQWPITSELLDWEKIQQIAEQDEQIGSELESAT